MRSYFNLDELTPIIKDFYLITHIRITVFDADFHEITSYVPEKAPICADMRKNPIFDEACRECDRTHMAFASHSDEPYIYTCHAGLKEIIAPLRVNQKIIGYLFFSHILNFSSKEEAFEAIKERAGKYTNFDEKKVKEYIDSMPLFSDEYLKAASRLLMETASYLIENRVVYFKSEDLSFKIDDYITTHLEEDLSSKRLCSLFGIGKTYLYQLTDKLYDEPLASHIRKLRIKRATELMEEDSNMKISAIAQKVGFNDYYSFLSSFRSITGKNPKEYYNQIKASDKEASRTDKAL